MKTLELFREIIKETDISEMPHRFISAAILTDEDGMENVLTGDDLDDLLARRYPYDNVEFVNVMLDIHSIASEVIQDMTDLYAKIEESFED